MPYRILMELAIFLSPFAMFGLYRLAIRDAEVEGRKAWPINALFGIGFVLAVLLWLYFILREDRDRNMCSEAARFDSETRELIPGREYECDSDVETLGRRIVEEPDRPEPPADGEDD